MAIRVDKRLGTTAVRFAPDFYKRAYNQYRDGVFADIIEMMNRAEVDSHVSGCLIGRKAGFQQDFSLTSFDDNDEDQERALIVQNMLKNLDHRLLFKDVHEARLKKFSVVDFEWEIVDGRQVPVSHEKMDHKYFKYDRKTGELMINFGRDLREIPRDEALVCETKETPVLLPVLRDYILKEFGLESWAAFIETFGEPLVIGKYPAGADGPFKDELEAAVKKIARSSRGTMPEGSDIDIKEISRTTGDHERFVDISNQGISITILGHRNAVEQSRGLQVGENLTQYKVKREVAVDDMFFIDACVQKLIRIIVDRNWGDGRYPVFEFDKTEPPPLRDMIDLIDLFWNMGLEIHPDEARKLGLIVSPEQEPMRKQQDPFNLRDQT